MGKQAWTTASVVRTGVELRRVDGAPADGVTGHLFADLEIGDEKTRVLGGAIHNRDDVVPGNDPMAELADVVETVKDLHRGDFYGELRIEGVDVTLWEFYAAPFQVELLLILRTTSRGGGTIGTLTRPPGSANDDADRTPPFVSQPAWCSSTGLSRKSVGAVVAR